MICDYGCGQTANYLYKNGKYCCSKNFRMCPNMRKKGVRDPNKINKKVVCPYCKTPVCCSAIKKHMKACHLNPENIKICKNCNQILKNIKNIFCSKRCAASYNNKYRSHSDETKEKIKSSVITSFKQKGITKQGISCILCGTIHKNKKFCSSNCFREFTKKNPGYYKKELSSEYKRYRLDCKFVFNVFNYPEYFDLSLIEKYGWYQAKNRGNNLNGISRDHMISIVDGFKYNIPPDIIKHPANCQLMRHSYNNKKNTKSSITIEVLESKIKSFEVKNGNQASNCYQKRFENEKG